MNMDKVTLALTIAQIAEEGAKACERKMVGLVSTDSRAPFVTAQIFCLALAEGAVTIAKKTVEEG